MSQIYNLFISHSWSYSDTYDKLIYFLTRDSSFHFKNYSVPKYDPIHNANNDWQLKCAIREQMSHASCVLIMAGMYATYSKWINIEIDLARNGFASPKKIIAIEPWGAERTSLVVKNAADRVVKWNSDSIIRAIKGECDTAYLLHNWPNI